MNRNLKFRTINHWRELFLACILAIFACLAFTSVPAFADEADDACLTSSASSNVTMYRLYNQWTGEHFYTSNKTERDTNIKAG